MRTASWNLSTCINDDVSLFPLPICSREVWAQTDKCKCEKQMQNLPLPEFFRGRNNEGEGRKSDLDHTLRSLVSSEHAAHGKPGD